MDPRSQQNRRVFFSEQNEAMLYGILEKNYQQRIGGPLDKRRSARLESGLEYYMSAVFESNGSLPIQTLNKEVLSATSSDFNDYLQREVAVAQSSPQEFQETSQRFEQIQQDRQRSQANIRPAVPDYVQPIVIKEDDSVSALSLFEEAKARRNLEVSAQAEEQLTKRSNSTLQPIYAEGSNVRPDPRSMYDRPLDMVVAGQQQELSGRGDGNPTIARSGSLTANRGSLQQDILIKQENIQSYKETEYNLSIYSADRNWELDLDNGQNRFNFSANLYSGNSPIGVSLMPKGANRLRNIVRIEFVKAVVPIEVTDMLVRQVTSTDSPDEQQAMVYAYAVAITSISAPVATAPIAAGNLAVENLEKLRDVNNLLRSSVKNHDTSLVKNIYGFPYVTLNVEELDTNTYGTNNSMDNAFGILQYDSNWTDNTNTLGFTSLIPKHMKCQRVYSPTPLATLNKLTIRLQQPNGNLVNSVSDTMDISGIFLSSYTSIRTYFPAGSADVNNNNVGGMDLSGTAYSDSEGQYIWLDCKKWFNRYQVVIGDRIQIRNLKCVSPTPAITDLMNFLQDSNGHVVMGTAYSRAFTTAELITNGLTSNQITTGTSGTRAASFLDDGSNEVGYCRYIIIRGKFQDPTTGATAVAPYGGMVNNVGVASDMVSGSTRIIPGRLMNLSKQTQFIFRVITREYDSASLVRPDNL
jgi:hypothetical protein